MNVLLTNQMEQWVQQKVGSGFYSSNSEVVMEALRMLHAIESRKNSKFAHLQNEVQEGINSAEQGELLEWTTSLSNDIKEIARKRRQA